MLDLDDTIAAIASPPGGAARGIVRVCGPTAIDCVATCFEPSGRNSHEFRYDRDAISRVRLPTALAGQLRLDDFHSPLPAQLLLWPTARSYARQPTAELHTLGSPPLLEAVLRQVCAAGARLARPGEFTLRAFLAGRLDLTQAEAVLGVIDAADRRELDTALAQLAGGLGKPLRQLRECLLDLLAHLEAGLDFADEAIEFISAADLERQLAAAAADVERLADQMASRGEATRTPCAVLIGWPNTGKSSLFNALAARGPASAVPAIVSDQAGTTRDWLRSRLDLDGLECELVDTAGVEPNPCGSQGIAASAQSLTAERRSHADVEIFCLDATRPLNAWEGEQLSRGGESNRLVVWTKTDQACVTDARRDAIATSSVTGAGLDELCRRIRAAALGARASSPHFVAGTAARCRESLARAAVGLFDALVIARRGTGEELVAAELRLALDELGQVVGAVYTDDVLDRIFSRFCIGK
ncbi:MAG TPA: tRNA modification GTPase [Pirellulales bacterium]|nr:tRNA modification GTPase [Pirellulales bacterium]